ncbi:uncharacterized protein CCOS01_03877 [Colletotrichum costaricense]|uniref:Uncharacterized protein n=1 Tax=Colletotrichum costaricense TaxID=1209916 RepID=A0AAI9Z7F7_9PEZI|nr:uncharacterized protein CCOS01_03877 [Colletotrichum costaricense]KAK1535125.1 hypothetical protein CCOS01_03877 [Colletotrichum costaricense]
MLSEAASMEPEEYWENIMPRLLNRALAEVHLYGGSVSKDNRTGDKRDEGIVCGPRTASPRRRVEPTLCACNGETWGQPKKLGWRSLELIEIRRALTGSPGAGG